MSATKQKRVFDEQTGIIVLRSYLKSVKHGDQEGPLAVDQLRMLIRRTRRLNPFTLLVNADPRQYRQVVRKFGEDVTDVLLDIIIYYEGGEDLTQEMMRDCFASLTC